MRFYNVTMKPNIIDKWVDKIEKWEEKYIYMDVVGFRLNKIVFNVVGKSCRVSHN